MSNSGERSLTIEYGRLAAVTGIVLFHTSGGEAKLIGYSGLPFFLLLSGYFLRGNSISAYIGKKAGRLLRPWLLWSVVYAIYLLIFNYFSEEPFFKGFEPEMLLYGGSVHLWYLPFLFLFGLLLTQLEKLSNLRFFMPISMFCSLICLFFLLYLLKEYHFPVPIAQWLFSFPLLYSGWLIGLYQRKSKGLFSLIFPMGAIITLNLFLVNPIDSIPYLLGFIWFIISICFPVYGAFPPRLDISLTIYLVHPLIGRFFVVLIGYSPLLFPCTMAGSLLFSLIIEPFVKKYLDIK